MYQLKTHTELQAQYPEIYVDFRSQALVVPDEQGRINKLSGKMLGLKISFVACWPWWAIKGVNREFQKVS